MSSIDSDARSVDMQGGPGARGYDPLAAGAREHVRSRTATWRDDSRKDPEELEREIDETRADVQATLEALERKLAPERLLDQTLGRVRSHGGEFAGNLGHAVKQNPVPLLLTSIGIAWMMMSNRRNGDGMGLREDDGPGMRERFQGARERWSGKAGEAREGVRQRLSSAKEAMRRGREGAGEHMEHARDTMARTAESMRSGAGRAASMARRDYERVRSGFDHLLEEQPLLLGAIGIAAGAIVGAALPATESEDRWIGEARDRALERAKRAGGEGYREARQHAEALARKAKSALGEGARAMDEPSREPGGMPTGRDERSGDYESGRDQNREPGIGADQPPPI